MEDLIDVLNKEEEQYQGLIELGKEKEGSGDPGGY